jgi:hypothetical protein
MNHLDDSNGLFNVIVFIVPCDRYRCNPPQFKSLISMSRRMEENLTIVWMEMPQGNTIFSGLRSFGLMLRSSGRRTWLRLSSGGCLCSNELTCPEDHKKHVQVWKPFLESCTKTTFFFYMCKVTKWNEIVYKNTIKNQLLCLGPPCATPNNVGLISNR